MPNILVVDDDDAIRDYMARALEISGHRVHTACSNEAGAKIYHNNRIDLSIIDIFMPDKDGIELIREFVDLNPEGKILAISGGGKSGNTDVLSAARLLGATYALEKPFTFDELIGAVEHTLAIGPRYSEPSRT